MINEEINEKSLVIYKNRPALVAGVEGEKLNIKVFGGDNFKVREKDLELLHPGPCTLSDLEERKPSDDSRSNAQEAWELMVDSSDSASMSLKELAELVYGVFDPRSAWAAWELLR